MAGIDDELAKQEKLRNKAKFSESIKKYKGEIDDLLKRIRKFEKDIGVKTDELNGYRHVIAANDYLKVISLYCNMNDESMHIMNIKNENYLNEARKLIYQVLIHLEEVVTAYIDVPPNELEERLNTISRLNPQHRLNLINNIGYRISQIVEGFGDNTKWKWSFVEIEGRYATVVKNIADYRVMVANNDPRKPFYMENINLMRIIREQLDRASKRYREKYEQTTKETEDIKKSIAYLAAARRIAILFNESEEAVKLKRMIELATKLMEDNIKKKETEKKAPAAQRKK